MAEIEKLNKTFQKEQVLGSDEMNSITSKIDEVVEQVNNGGGLSDAPSDGKTYGRKDGAWNKTVGEYSEGGEIFNDYSYNIATGVYSHAEGISTEASGTYSHAEGSSTRASSDSSHAEGDNTTASGTCSHAEGVYTIADGYSSHAEGNGTTASGFASHAEGSGTKSDGKYSHSSGITTNAKNYAQTSIGCINISDSSPSPESFNTEKCAFVIGNGTESYPSQTPGDAFRVFFNGKVESDLDYSTPAADYAEMFEWKDGNTNHEDRVGLFVTLDGENIVLANSNSTYILGIISAVPAVLGDSPIQWQGKYLNDEWGRPIYEDVEYTEVKEVVKEDGTTEKVKEKKAAHIRKINPDYNQDETYKSRADRPEWDAVGLLGKLLVKHDGTLVQGGFCKPSDNGIATKSDSGYYVMKVVNDHQALVLFR